MFTRSDDSGDGAPFFRSRGRILAAGFLAATLVISVISLVTGGDEGETRAVPAASRGPLSQSLAKGTDRPEGCRTDDTARGLPKAAPADVKWRTVGGTRVPTSASAGPTRSTGPVRWCFAHTPMGAVMAAHIIPAQMTGPDWRSVIDEQVVAGFGRNLFVSQRSSLADTSLKTRQSGRYMGFAVEDYDKDSAKVNVLIKSPQGSFITTTVSVRWSNGDWKVEPGNDGGLHSTVTAVGGPDGFVQWEV
ncbi:hypothetical protein [Streptomyces flaveolus]|uniref:hypothetical protein n=1 Tax=Streptomyces flaveolus TaxID=67297 RepID=UPI0033FFE6A6